MALKRALSLSMLIFYGIGMILGAGIFSVIGVAASEAGSSLWISFLLAGVVALLTGLAYAELASLYPKAGAEYSYLRQVFPSRPWIGTSMGLVVAFSGVATASTVAVAFAGYFRQYVDVPVIPIAFGLIALVSAVNLFGIRESAWMNALFTLIEVGGLALFIYFGLKSGKIVEPLGDWSGAGTAIGATGLVVFSYFGFENIATLSEESKKPERDVPLAILISISVATTMYLLVSLSLIALVEPSKLAGSESPLTQALQGVSAAAAKSLGVVALFSTANTALISLVAVSRLLFSMGRDGEIPKAVSKTLSKRKTPWVACIVAFVATAALIPLGSVKILASISSLATLVAFTSVNFALLSHRREHPREKKGFRVPGAIGFIPIPTVIAIGITFVLITQFELKAYLLTLPLFLLALVFSIFWKRR